MAAAVVAFAVATVTSLDPANSGSGFVRYLELFVVVPLGVALALRTRRDALLVCAAVVVAALIEGTVGTVQYVTGTGASYEGQNVRAVGTFNALDVQAMATVVGYGVVVAVGLAVALRGWARRWLLLIALLLVVPLLLSLSRGESDSHRRRGPRDAVRCPAQALRADRGVRRSRRSARRLPARPPVRRR